MRSPTWVLVVLPQCTHLASAAQVAARNREFNDLTGNAENAGFNHSAQEQAGQAIGLHTAASAPGPLLCLTGVCDDGSCCGGNGKCGFEDENCGAGCVSNCNATAMCGRKSDGGHVACGMNLCCSYSSWCGYEDVHCQHADGFGTGLGDCQAGMGYCGDPGPKMPKTHAGTSSSGRKIGYWQSNNIHKRQFKDGKFKCPPSRPGDIPLDHGIPLGDRWTHLYYAFGAINPTTVKIVDDPSKRSLYREFTTAKYIRLRLPPR
ncbi:hypothetical protein Sste5346_007570 [Sporothrix stenoceras]|uniref:Chitin-binding type-1 domain-containing protein n=1 Tax=Sporothrix stenoceras TaxID=5173 RepID=A0ABR3YU46_9PEZI